MSSIFPSLFVPFIGLIFPFLVLLAFLSFISDEKVS
jgi:hypothetical protein